MQEICLDRIICVRKVSSQKIVWSFPNCYNEDLYASPCIGILKRLYALSPSPYEKNRYPRNADAWLSSFSARSSCVSCFLHMKGDYPTHDRNHDSSSPCNRPFIYLLSPPRHVGARTRRVFHTTRNSWDVYRVKTLSESWSYLRDCVTASQCMHVLRAYSGQGLGLCWDVV